MLRFFKKPGSQTEYGQWHYEVRKSTLTLISVANRAESQSSKNVGVEFTDATEVAMAREVIDAQQEMIHAVKLACRSGLSLEEIHHNVVDPVIDASVVGEVAWMLINQVIAGAMNGARSPPGVRTLT